MVKKTLNWLFKVVFDLYDLFIPIRAARTVAALVASPTMAALSSVPALSLI
jgi:hypothetical protein